MTENALGPFPADNAIDAIRSELANTRTSRGRRVSKKFVIAAVSAIPWVGGFLAAAAEIPDDEAAEKGDDLRTKWLEAHQEKFKRLEKTVGEVHERFENLGPETQERVESPEYLALVRQAFRTWDNAETEEKRRFVANLIANSAGTRVCSDDVIRLFIGWLDLYHESHFTVIREIHQNPGSTRFDIWSGAYGEGELPREDGAEADLYRMLIRDLSTGGVIRQTRDTNEAGQFLRKRAARRRSSAPTTMKSAFDDKEQYVLTDLGKQFVHYTLLGDVRRLGATNG